MAVRSAAATRKALLAAQEIDNAKWPEDLTGLVEMHGLLASLKGHIAQLISFTEDELKRQMDDLGLRETMTTAGFVEARRAAKRSGWKHDELAPLVFRKLLLPAFDGDLDQTAAVSELLRLRFPASFAWRVGEERGLKSLDIDPDEFCVTEWATSIKVVPTVG